MINKLYRKYIGRRSLKTVIYEAVADPGRGAGGPMPPVLWLVQIGQKRWPPCAAAHVSCLLAPLSEFSGSATVKLQFTVKGIPIDMILVM